MNQKESNCAPTTGTESANSAEKLESCCAAVGRNQQAAQGCSPPKAEENSCCPPAINHRKAGYRIEPFVKGWANMPVGEIPVIERKLKAIDYRGRIAMRWGIGREQYMITPGLYAIGSPNPQSEVLVSANYKLSLDALRSSIEGIDAWILVIDTKGINVWCAAGKGTFGTDEIVRCVHMVKLKNLVEHRRLIVPQLGAPGVAAHLVKKGCGFTVVYGPVRANDLPDFFAADMQATAVMRRVSFSLLERTILTPVEITMLRRQILYVALALMLLGGIGSHVFNLAAAWTRGSGAVFTGIVGLLSGSILTPMFLPWLPGRAFSLKGAWIGLGLAFVLALSLFSTSGLLNQTALLLQVTAISSYTAMNFTGSSTYTSPSGVEKEMRLAIPCQLTAATLALVLWLWAAF